MARIVLTGGGSAGHIEPAVAVADELRKQDPEVSLLFLGTDSSLEQDLIAGRGYQLRAIPKVSLPRRLNRTAISFPIRLLGAFVKARQEIKGADALVGFGGYVSATAYLAALSLRIPITIHEANAKPGWANRLGRYFAKNVAVNFGSLAERWQGSVVTGMPIRASIVAVTSMTSDQLQSTRRDLAVSLGFKMDQPIVAIFGGSLGSTQINKAVSEAIQIGLGSIQVLHSLGNKNVLPEPQPGYVPTNYITDMASVYAAADLIICRSGAVTCSELITTGKFAILVPLPHGNGEQLDNATELVARGLAMMVRNEEFTGLWLLANLTEALTRAKKLGDQRSLESVNAAAQIAKLVLTKEPISDVVR